jgi:hypothetical protein
MVLPTSSNARVEIIPRGFGCSADDAVCYLVWLDGEGVYSYSLKCVCGTEQQIFPDASGVVEYKHLHWRCRFKFTTTLKLEGWNEWLLTKAERKAAGLSTN